MTTFPGSPKVMRGALVVNDPQVPTPRVIAFQYNPETLTRSLESQGSGESELEALRLSAPPVETIQLEAVLDAADRLGAGDPGAEELGLHAQLAALELLLYPPSSRVLGNAALLAAGSLEVLPPEGPLVVFIWGRQRVLPVRLTEFSVTEEAYDPRLNPIRVRISLGLRVLSYHDLPRGHRGYDLFLAHQAAKEALAVRGRTTIDGVASGAGPS